MSTQPAPTRMDAIQTVIVQLEDGLRQLRLQQQDAQAQLTQANDAVQRQVGAIGAMQMLLQQMQAQPPADAAQE